jgi:hypothetical protein
VDKDKKSELKQNGPVTAVIVGAGHRSLIYGSYALEHPDQLKIVGVVEPNYIRRNHTAEIYNISPRFCFKSVDELAGMPPIADAVINGTMDKYHLSTSVHF